MPLFINNDNKIGLFWVFFFGASMLRSFIDTFAYLSNNDPQLAGAILERMLHPNFLPRLAAVCISRKSSPLHSGFTFVSILTFSALLSGFTLVNIVIQLYIVNIHYTPLYIAAQH
jgi:hypothetical protein